LASLLATNGHEVRLWSRGAEVADLINSRHENRVYLPGIKINESVLATTRMDEVLAGAGLVVVVVPSHAVRPTLEKAGPHIADDALLVSASKGIEDGSGKTMVDLIAEFSRGRSRVGVISGPSFAAEVASGQPTVVVAAADEARVAERIQNDFASLTLRVYSSTDVVGVEIGGVVKNIMAMVTGASDGLGFGHNARAAIITRGLAEITRLAVSLGAHSETLSGLSGLGDLVLTCTGDLSRNRQLGLRLGRGEPLQQIIGGMRMVAEGFRNTKAVKRLADRQQVEMPIVEAMYRVLYEELHPKQVIGELFGRTLKPEFG
jgi:glycerol-3-phosphate dehydrogenase (NAD(P)+)